MLDGTNLNDKGFAPVPAAKALVRPAAHQSAAAAPSPQAAASSTIPDEVRQQIHETLKIYPVGFNEKGVFIRHAIYSWENAKIALKTVNEFIVQQYKVLRNAQGKSTGSVDDMGSVVKQHTFACNLCLAIVKKYPSQLPEWVGRKENKGYYTALKSMGAMDAAFSARLVPSSYVNDAESRGNGVGGAGQGINTGRP